MEASLIYTNHAFVVGLCAVFDLPVAIFAEQFDTGLLLASRWHRFITYFWMTPVYQLLLDDTGLLLVSRWHRFITCF